MKMNLFKGIFCETIVNPVEYSEISEKSTYCHVSEFKLSDRRAWQKDFEERG